MSTHIRLATPPSFDAFPYQPPYSIQVELMQHLFSAIEDRKVALIESPTGTGKTLSLLTSALTWLLQDKSRVKKARLDDLRDSLEGGNDPDWVLAQTLKRLKSEYEDAERDFEEHLSIIRKKERTRKERMVDNRDYKRPKLGSSAHDEDNDDAFLPEDEQDRSSKKSATGESLIEITGVANQDLAVSRKTKILYASRTHTQLSQVIHELVKVKLNAVENDEASETMQHPRTVSLASRAHLCINSELRAKSRDLDEACRDLLKGGPEKRCPHLPPLGEGNGLNNLRDAILADPMDIEDLVVAGKSSKLCPYFASRSAVNYAEVVTLPYNLLLYKRSREALEIDVADCVVLIDEAHNLIDSILQLYSVDISLLNIQKATAQLAGYFSRFRTRLKTIHANNLKRLMIFLKALEKEFTQTFRDSQQSAQKTMTVSQFIHSMGEKVNGINFLEIQDYLQKSKIARKVVGYADKMKKGNNAEDILMNDGSVLPLHTVEAFIASLTNDVEEGIITYIRDSEGLRLRYQHLNPSTHFSEILTSARCVVLAGGTMSPFSDIKMQLFPTLARDRISTFSCGHVIPATSLQCVVIGKGPTGRDMQFTFKNRGNDVLYDDLGQSLLNLANLSPNGMVVFVPSYAFLDAIKGSWSSKGFLQKFERKKQLFFEPKLASDVDSVLREYGAACINQNKGALLLAVVGGKLSEGLNFSDELARLVVLVGIPFPNLASSELRERMKYVSKLVIRSGKSANEAKNAGNELYENLAMRAVNQSIGRAIRHQRDWSALVLVDIRYGNPKIRSKLSAWIRDSVVVTQSFGQAVKMLGDFYHEKRTRSWA